jgi:hypothetical protein
MAGINRIVLAFMPMEINGIRFAVLPYPSLALVFIRAGLAS